MANSGFLAGDRAVLRISGKDHRKFLQDLVTNDVEALDRGAIYAALLSPQGKYLFDFFMIPDGDGILIDVKSDRAAALAQRLSMYKLRADVVIDTSKLQVIQVLGQKPVADRVFADPRHAALGWRVYSNAPDALLLKLDEVRETDWINLRITHLVPETGIELKPDDAYILEHGFERLNGVDFSKGCYVGQEVTARMKHKTRLRKGLTQVQIAGDAPEAGTPVFAGEKQAGELLSNSGDTGLAYLRFDLAKGVLRAGDAMISLTAPDQ